MSSIRGRENRRTELEVIKLFRRSSIKGWRRGQKIRFDSKKIPRATTYEGTCFKPKVRPDFVFPAQKLALFIDGCFWHGCLKCFSSPKSNKRFWSAKIKRNIDGISFKLLRCAGLDGALCEFGNMT